MRPRTSASGADTLGGVPTPFGQSEIYKFANVLVFAREGEPTGGTKGTTVNHIGFWVPSVRAALAKVRGAGYPIVTRDELPPAVSVIDQMAYLADQDTYIAYVMGPDGVKVELVENRTQAEPIALHHIHFDANDVDAMKAWYVDMFGAAPGMRGSFQAADLPGVNLTLFTEFGGPGRHAGTQPRPHRFRGRQPRGVLPGAGGQGHRVRPPVPGDRGARARDCVLHGSVGHLHRAHRGAGRVLMAPGTRCRAGFRRGLLNRARRRLAGLLLLAALAPTVATAAQRPLHLDPLLLEQYVGQYRLSASYVLTILVENERLYVRAPTRGTRLLVPTSETEFVEVQSGLRITFRIRADTRRVDHLVFGAVGVWPARGPDLGRGRRRPAARPALALPAATLARYVGRYEEQPGFAIAITRDGDRLLAQMTDQDAMEIFAESETDFFYRDRDARISFRVAGDRVEALVWRQGGAVLEMRRMD